MRQGPPAAPLTNADAERSLAALERWAADSDRPVIVLAGAAKTGKTVLLDVLASRLGRYFSVVYLSRPGSDPDEVSTRILSALGEIPDGTPRLVLAREIERRADRPLIVLLDDADTLPPRVELWLFDLARRSAGALRLVLALSDARLAREFAAAFRADTEIAPLGASMGQAEAESYLRLVPARASEPQPAALHPRAAGDAEARPPRTAPAPPRSEPRPAEPAQPLAALASIAGSTSAPTPAPERRQPAAAPPAAPAPAPPRARVEAPPQPPPVDAPAGAARKGPRLRWVALAAALVFGFVAGFLLSELRDAQGPEFLERVDVGRPADLPSVSAPPPDPFTPPPLPEAAPPLAERDVGLAVENAPIETSPVAVDPRPVGEGTAPAEAASAEAAAPLRATETAAANEIAPAPAPEPAPADAGVADAGAPLDSEAAAAFPVPPAASAEPSRVSAEPPRVSAEPPAVRAAPPPRPRFVRVEVQAEPGAEIRLGGRELGAAPVGSVDLPPGPHRLLVRMPDGREVDRIVEVRGTRYEIQVR